VLVVPAEGRSSSQRNATIVNAYLLANVGPDERLVVIGYSKGLPDFLEALALYPDAPWVKRVDALVSVGGIVSGSPIADRYERLYADLLAQVPWNSCAPGDGGAVTSLTRRERMAWLTTNRLPSTMALFSVAAIPARVPTNPLLMPFAARLSKVDRRNDGQVLIQDAVLPGSFLVGYADADHWALALPFNRSQHPDAALLATANAFPREVLIISILTLAEEVLRDRAR
jgi:hypothetical protein